MLCYQSGTCLVPSHFKLYEFENADGLAMVDSTVVQSLEMTRIALGKQYECEVQIIVTSGIRTVDDNERLAARLRWVHDGGLVAKDSKHLAKYGGIAVDIIARFYEDGKWIRVEQLRLASACRDQFSYVKADYKDGHVHADNR